MISPKERVRPVQANPQIQAVKKQATGLKGAVMEVRQAAGKKVHHLKDANPIQEGLILLVIVLADVLQAEVHLIVLNQIPMIGQKEALVTIVQAKKEVSNQEAHHILADRRLMIDLKEASTAILRGKRKALNREARHILADQRLMTVLKEVLEVNLQVRRKALNQEVHLTLADQLQTTDLKEANPQAKGNFQINQVSKVLKVRVIESSTDARQKVRDLKNALMIRLTSHSANQKIHPIINLQLSATRMQNRCVAEKNQALKMILA
jgi:hypothetical protein